MNIVFFSRSPLAGAPIRIVGALRRHTDHDVRLVDLKRWGIYDHDVVYAENPDEVAGLADKADIIHLNNYLDYDSTDFYPVDFNALRGRGKLFVRQFASSPMLVAKVMGTSVSDLLASPLPSVVIAQFQERFYPKARVVPNIIPQDDLLYRPDAGDPSWGIVFSPSSTLGAWDDRWNTKGVPETLLLMKQVARRTGCTIRFLTGRPLADVLRDKRRAAVVIDELVTGSYHLSGLEGLSLGKPVLAFVDDRVQQVLREISGSETCPFINVRLEDAFEVLVYLLQHPDEMTEIGRASRGWIERYWADHTLVQHYVDVYEKLVTDPGLVVRQESLNLDGGAVRFTAVALPDLVYRSRGSTYRACLPMRTKVWRRVERGISRLNEPVARYLPDRVVRFLVGAWRVTRRLLLRGVSVADNV